MIRQHPELRLCCSHLGLPPPYPAAAAPPLEECRAGIGEVLALAAFPGPRVKLSGFYALVTPSHAVPHRASWGKTSAVPLRRLDPTFV